jgi:hypothetical protein
MGLFSLGIGSSPKKSSKGLDGDAPSPGSGPSDTTPGGVSVKISSSPALSSSPSSPVFPVYHHIPGLGGPDQGPWSDRCCETSDTCCRGVFHDCCYPAHDCCRCPPWFLVVAFVFVVVSFLVNFGVVTPFFRVFVRCVCFKSCRRLFGRLFVVHH